MSWLKKITISDPQSGRMTEQVIRENMHHMPILEQDPLAEFSETLNRTRVNKGLLSLKEAFVQTPDSANMLRNGFKFLAFTRYRELAAGWEAFVMQENSSLPQEEYLRDGAIGVFPEYKSGEATQFVRSSFEGGVIVKNKQFRAGVEIAMDEIRFDRIGKIKQVAFELGRAGRMTEAKAAFDVLTDTANYVRSNTAGDNDVSDVGSGANTQTLTFNGVNFEAAKRIIGTAKDRKSGSYLGLTADTLICGPALEVAAKQLLMSDTIQRQHGNTSVEVRGTGTKNIYFGMVNNIIVSPWFSSSYNWALMDSSMLPIVFQRVEPFNVIQEDAGATSESYLVKDSIRYVAMTYFGVGMVDDRSIFFSNSSTAPTVS